MDGERTTSSVTALTDGSPTCVMAEFKYAADAKPAAAAEEEEDDVDVQVLVEPVCERYAPPPSTKVNELSGDIPADDAVEDRFAADLQHREGFEEENYEVELKDVEDMFRKGASAPGLNKKRMKKFMSKKFLNFMSPTAVDKDGEVSVCDQSMEISLRKQLDALDQDREFYESELSSPREEPSVGSSRRMEAVDEASELRQEEENGDSKEANDVEQVGDETGEDGSTSGSNTTAEKSKSSDLKSSQNHEITRLRSLKSIAKVNPSLKSRIFSTVSKESKSKNKDDLGISLHESSTRCEDEESLSVPKQSAPSDINTADEPNEDSNNALTTEWCAGGAAVLSDEDSVASNEDKSTAATGEEGLGESLEVDHSHIGIEDEETVGVEGKDEVVVSEVAGQTKQPALRMKNVKQLAPKLRRFMSTKVTTRDKTGANENMRATEAMKEDVSVSNNSAAHEKLEVLEAKQADAKKIEDSKEEENLPTEWCTGGGATQSVEDADVDEEQLGEVVEIDDSNLGAVDEVCDGDRECEAPSQESGEMKQPVPLVKGVKKLGPKLRRFMSTKVSARDKAPVDDNVEEFEDKEEDEASHGDNLEVLDNLVVIEKLEVLQPEKDIKEVAKDVSGCVEPDELVEEASKKSSIDMSVFDGKGCRSLPAIGENSIVEGVGEVTGDNLAGNDAAPLEFRQMQVTLKFKALAGVTQVSSTQKPNNDDIKAVVTYRQNTIASDRFVSTNVPSLPIFKESIPGQAEAQVYAQWPCGQKDDDTASTAVLLSSVSLKRTVRRVRNHNTASHGATAGGSVEEPNEGNSKQFLASLSKAFAPDLLDLQVGLMQGSSELIPLGIATVVIPGEFSTCQLDIPVVPKYRDNQTSKGKISLRGLAKSQKDHTFFSTDKDTKYKVNAGAFLRLELKIEPAVESPVGLLPPARQLSALPSAKKANFRSGPINKAIRSRRNMDRLVTLKKLPLHRRIRMYRERIREGNGDKNMSPESKDIYISSQATISEVSCELHHHCAPSDADHDKSGSLLQIDQFQLDSWPSMETSSKSTKSRHRPASKEELLQVSDDALLDSEVSVVSQSSAWSVRKQVLLGEASDPAIALADTEDKQDETATNHSRQSVAKSSVQPEEDETATLSTPSIVPAEKRTTSISSFLASEQDGRLSRASQFTDMDQFSSSLHSVFTYDHPQKSTMAQNVMDLLFCSNELHLCEQEKRALRYYANDQEEKLARYCAPYVQGDKLRLPHEEKIAQYCSPMSRLIQDDLSYQDASIQDEDTFASLDNASLDTMSLAESKLSYR